jgi:predicted chitinase
MTLDRAVLFLAVRKALFGGKLTALQVSGIERLLDAFERYGTRDRRHLSYLLATSFHETGRRMQPVREGFAASDAAARAAVAKLLRDGKIKRNYALPNAAGVSFYGRGDVQLTHEDNYRRMGGIIGIDLVGSPDLALDPAVSARILVEGVLRAVSLKGDFTAFALEDFIAGDRCDYVGARKTVNGTDEAAVIAGYAELFEAALASAGATTIIMRSAVAPVETCPTCHRPLAA